MKESEIIQSFFAKNQTPLDDCHLIPPNTLVTTDSLVEGTHFLHNWSNPTQLAQKLIEVNVSDIAASGGIPNICFLNLGLSDVSKQKSWVSEFSKAFKKRIQKYHIRLVGGDTFYSQTTHLTLTLFGKTKKAWFRDGGKDGDTLYLTGTIGNSELGLQSLKQNWPDSKFKLAKKKHLTPDSRLSIVPALSRFQIHACMDLTDGLIQDAKKLAKASCGHLEIDLNSLPVSKIALQMLGWDGILSSGEELELLILSKNHLPKKIKNLSITPIGKFIKSNTKKKSEFSVTFLLDGQKYRPSSEGFVHF